MQMDHGFGATKHMTLHRATFDTYEIIAPHNVHLGDDSVVEVIGMESNVVEAIMRNDINRFCIKSALHVSKLQTNLLFVSKLVLNELKLH